MKALYILDENKIPMKCNDILMFGNFFSNPKNYALLKSEIGEFQISSSFLGIDGKFETILYHKENILETSRQDSFAESVNMHNELRKRILETYVK